MTTTTDLEQRTLAVPDQAKALTITNAASYEAATDFLLTVKDLLKEVDATFAPMTAKAHAAWKETLAQRQRHERPLLEAETIVKGLLATYARQQEQARLATQKKAQENAQLQEALDAEARGDKAGTEAALNGHGLVSVQMPPAVPKTAGIAMREQWDFEIADPALIPREYLMPDTAKIGQIVRAMKGETKISGIRLIKRDVVAAGRRI